jgi:hypothetical protein
VSEINLRVVHVGWQPCLADHQSCRKSTNLSWEGEEPSAAADEEDPSPMVQESAPVPQGETVAQVAEATPPEATIVEGT